MLRPSRGMSALLTKMFQHVKSNQHQLHYNTQMSQRGGGLFPSITSLLYTGQALHIYS